MSTDRGNVMQRHAYLLALPAAALMAAAGTACATGTAQPPPSTIAPTTSPPTTRGQVSAQDRSWLTGIHQANLAEIEMGDLAEKKGSTPAVRSAGRMLTSEHTDFDRKVTRAAGRLGVTLPTALAAADATAANRLRGETGKTFDQDFLATMVSGHEKAIADTKTQVSQGSSRRVIALAKEGLPHLRKHLAVLKKAAASG